MFNECFVFWNMRSNLQLQTILPILYCIGKTCK